MQRNAADGGGTVRVLTAFLGSECSFYVQLRHITRLQDPSAVQQHPARWPVHFKLGLTLPLLGAYRCGISITKSRFRAPRITPQVQRLVHPCVNSRQELARHYYRRNSGMLMKRAARSAVVFGVVDGSNFTASGAESRVPLLQQFLGLEMPSTGRTQQEPNYMLHRRIHNEWASTGSPAMNKPT